MVENALIHDLNFIWSISNKNLTINEILKFKNMSLNLQGTREYVYQMPVLSYDGK